MPKTFKQFEDYDIQCEEVIFEHENEPLQEAEYQGKTVKLNTPRALRKGETGHGKKRKVVFVKDPSTGRVKKITFGDANLGMHKGDKARKKSYCARSAGMGSDRTKANYWARRDWGC